MAEDTWEANKWDKACGENVLELASGIWGSPVEEESCTNFSGFSALPNITCLFRVPGVFHKADDHAPRRVPDGAHTQVSALCGLRCAAVMGRKAGKYQVLHWS